MRKYIDKVRLLVFSSTAKDTYLLFGGNLLSAFLGFVYTLIIARALSVSDFGIFSAAVNLVIILISVTDLGISSGAVNFIAERYAKGETEAMNKFIKASVVIRLVASIIAGAVVIIFAKYLSLRLLATTDPWVSVLTGIVSICLALPMLFPFILQAQKRFLGSVVSDNSLYLSRLIFAIVFMFATGITIGNSLVSYILGGLVGTLVGLILVRPGFVLSTPGKATYINLVKFSGWIGVNRIISSISGRLDIQMLAAMAGAVATGLYSIPSRLATFIIVLSSSFSSVLAPRLAAFGDKEKEKSYILKSTLALVPITAGIVLWIAIAEPFILLLFGNKYLPSVPVFQALAASMIPFLFTVPSVTAIIYAMKKTVFIGAFSFFQIAAIAVLNYVLIPKYGPFGPTITFGVTNTILAIYTWAIVVRYYWPRK